MNIYWFSLLFLFCALLLNTLITALKLIGRNRANEEFTQHPLLLLFGPLYRRLFGSRYWESLFFSLSAGKALLYTAYGLSLLFFLPKEGYAQFLFIFTALLLSLAVEFSSFFLASHFPLFFLRFFSPITSLLLLLISLITIPLFKCIALITPASYASTTPFPMKSRLLELLSESEASSQFDLNDQKLLLSVASFKERVAREVMVPRIDLFTLPSSITIKEASLLFLEQGYSRIPIYRESVDQIIGVLLYKDVLASFIEKRDLSQPIETLIKPVLYTPETKKLSQLLQEFRIRQTHLAIVVDEYGGTEGIVTIEDILEELVGEIADEYDFDQEALFSLLPAGGWIVDAKMNILDIEKELDIEIPPSAEYDTLGGFIFHKAGEIPKAGWKIHLNKFDLEVLSSSEKSIEKVKITPIAEESDR